MTLPRLKQRLLAGIVGVAAAVAASSPARAQIADAYQPVSPDLTGDDVLTRGQPEFSPIGGRLGSFFLYPRFSVDTGFTDNVLGTSTNKKSDGFAIARADVQLVSDWSRHRLEFLAYGQARRDFTVSSENTEAYGATVDGRYDVSNDSAINASFRVDRQPEDRLSIDNTAFTFEPVNFLTLDGNLRANKRFGALTLTGGLDVVRLSYDDAFGPTGPVLETDRNNTRLLYQGSARYDLTHNTALILAGQYDTIHYGTSIYGDRNSSGYRIEAGIGLAITHQIVGDIRIGYLHRTNADPIYPNLGGISFFANMTWTPTRLLSVRLTANRDIENSVTLASPGNLRSTGQLQLNYELLRQFIITPAFRFSRVTAIGGGGSNDEKEATVQGVYRFNRQFSLTGKFRHFDRTPGLYQPVNGNVGTLGLALTL